MSVVAVESWPSLELEPQTVIHSFGLVLVCVLVIWWCGFFCGFASQSARSDRCSGQLTDPSTPVFRTVALPSGHLVRVRLQ